MVMGKTARIPVNFQLSRRCEPKGTGCDPDEDREQIEAFESGGY
jgi:hypothetical protein